MHDARAIANFFIDRAGEASRSMSSMTLLKVLYFAHAWHLAKYNAPLVAQPFEAWKNGPVNRVVYDQIKGLGSAPITQNLISFDASLASFTVTKYEVSDDLDKFLANIFDFYSQFHAYTLSDLTHEEGSPWEKTWSEAGRKAVPGMVIPNETIRIWFIQSGPQHMRSAKQRYTI